MAVSLELLNSVTVPLLAFVFASDACLRDVLFPPHLNTVVDVYQDECAAIFNGGGCHSSSEVTTGVSFSTKYRFDGGRCASSVVALYVRTRAA